MGEGGAGPGAKLLLLTLVLLLSELLGKDIKGAWFCCCARVKELPFNPEKSGRAGSEFGT